MSTVHKTHIALTKELYRAFNNFNKKFADGELVTPIITLQPSEGKNAYGWFGSKFWTDSRSGKGVSEVNLSAEYLARGCKGVLETLLHEMAHLYNAQNGVRDCSSGQYHNKHFKKAAEKFGLVVTRLKNRGYARTKLGEEAEEAIKELDPKERLFSAFKRKTVQKKRNDKYATLIVRAQYKDLLSYMLRKTSCNQRELIETALEDYALRLGMNAHVVQTKTDIALEY